MDNTPSSAPYPPGPAANASTPAVDDAGQAAVPGQRPASEEPEQGAWTPSGEPTVVAHAPDPQHTTLRPPFVFEESAVDGEVVDGELTGSAAAGDVIRAEVISTGLDAPTQVVSSELPPTQVPYAGVGYPHAPGAQPSAPTVVTPGSQDDFGGRHAAARQAAGPYGSSQFPSGQYASSSHYPSSEYSLPQYQAGQAPPQYSPPQYSAPQYPAPQPAPPQSAPSSNAPQQYGAPQYAPPGQLAAPTPFSAPPSSAPPTPAPPFSAPPWTVPGQSPNWGGPSSAPPTTPYPGFPPPYYLPDPPRRNRRGLIVTLVIVGFVVLALCAGFLGYGLPSILNSDSSDSPKSKATASASAPALPADATDDQVVQAALDAQGAALLRGDQAAFLARVDPAAPAAVSAYKRLFHNMTQMHVKAWKASSGSLVDLSSGKQTFTMDITYCLNSTVCGDEVRTNMKVTAEKKAGKVVFEALAAPKASAATNDPLPWQVSTLTAVAGPRVVLAASSAWASRLPKVLPVAEAAAAAADKYAKWGTPPNYTIYLASTSEGKTWFHGGLKNADGVSYTLGPKDIQIMIMMPYATEEAYSGPGGINAVIQHEMGHVVTLWAMGDRSIDHDDFIEGIAEYISYTGHTSWAKYRIYDTRAYLRSHTFNKCYLTDQIVSSNVLTSSAAYGIGYLTMRYLASKYGQDKMLTFWGAYERDGDTLDAAARQTFATSWSSVNTGCVSYVRHAVGA